MSVGGERRDAAGPVGRGSGALAGPRELAAAIARQDIALAAFDVDGTLLTSAHGVTERLVAAVAAARAAGVEVVLASSRGTSVLRPVLAALGLDEPGAVFVAAGGAVVGSRDAAGRLRPLRHRPAPLGPSRAFAAAALAAGLAVSWYEGEDWYVAAADATIEEEARIVGVEPSIVAPEALAGGAPDAAGSTLGAPDKILVIAPAGRQDALDDLRAHLPDGLVAAISNPTYLEVTAVGVDKAVALADLAAARGLGTADDPTYRPAPGARPADGLAPGDHPIPRLLAMGDGPNDVTMLQRAALAIVPANARPQPRAAADLVVPANDADGAALVLEALARAHG